MPTADADAGGADVILDVVFEDGLFYLALANIGERPALKVSCRFERPFKGLGGLVDMSSLPLFRKVEFLAPGREIRTLLDSSAAYFARREPTRLAVTVKWRDDRGRHERPIVHDLTVYRSVAYLETGLGGP
ncbi:MAG: hypothetical protein ACR2M2_04890 [Gaiellaceae bacterium]